MIDQYFRDKVQTSRGIILVTSVLEASISSCLSGSDADGGTLKKKHKQQQLFIQKGPVNEYPTTTHYFGNPRHTQSMIAHNDFD